jgi:hypothetical protein
MAGLTARCGSSTRDAAARATQFDLAGLASKLHAAWAAFVQDDLPHIESAISSWLAAPGEARGDQEP